jgi:circadian clock protein KaiB
MKPDNETIYDLQLYIFGRTEKSVAAIKYLQHICHTYMADIYKLEIIDLSERPEMAGANKILATPTLIKKSPVSERRIIGDFSDAEKVLSYLGLKPAS